MSNYNLSSPIDVKASGVSSQINLFNTAGTFSVQLKAPTITSDIDFTLPSANGTTGWFLQRSGPSSLAWAAGTASSTVGKSLPTEIGFNIGNLPSSSITVTTSNTLIAYFMYNGSTLSGSPINFTIIYGLTAPATGRVVILDYSNSSVTVADTGTISTATTLGSFSVSSFTNVPTTQAIFQVNATGTGTGIVLHSLCLS